MNEFTIVPPSQIVLQVSNTILPENLPPIPGDRLPADVARKPEITDAMQQHLAAADPHSQYMTTAEFQTAIAQELAGLSPGGNVAQAILDHIGESDPHPQYVNGLEVTAAANAAITSHIAEDNPHPQYMTLAEVQQAIAQALSAFTPAAAPPPISVPYTITQSNNWNDNPDYAGTVAKLSDGNGSTGMAAGGTPSWLQASFDSAVTVNSVRVGGGNLPGTWGSASAELNGASLQYSINGSNWVTILQISGVTDSGASQFISFAFAPINARFWRLSRTSWLSTTEFSFA